VLRTLFLNPPSFEGFDGGAGTRYQARREIRPYWYPTWLAQPAALVPGSKLVDAPPAGLTLDDVIPLARGYDLVVLHTSSPMFAGDVKVAEALKAANPAVVVGFVDEEGLKQFRKRTTPQVNNKALEVARSMGMSVAINIIADPDWDQARFAFVREWAMSVPEIVNITVQTPYPGTETWVTEARRLTTLDYRLFDVQHAVLPTRLPLHQFYTELVKTQQVLARKHLGVAALAKTTGIVARQLLRGQTNFARMIWKFNSVYHPDRQYAEHQRQPRYLLPPPAERPAAPPDRKELYIHVPARRR
jgi:hypothetical protein